MTCVISRETFRNLQIGMCIAFVRKAIQNMHGSDILQEDQVNRLVWIFVSSLHLHRASDIHLYRFTLSIIQAGDRALFYTVS